MSKLCLDIMNVSLTVNWCVLCMNLAPNLRARVISSQRLKRYKQLMKVCQHFGDKPLLFAKLVTEQSLVWTLVVLSIVAICATNVIRFPFRANAPDTWQTIYIEALFGVNIGRYVFTVVQKVVFRNSVRKARFRADCVHHLVALACYSLFLSYRQNTLLGLVGIVIESTSIFDEAGRYFKERDRLHTMHYKRLVVIGCVWTVCFRGVIPITFLVIAMFQQTPFSMDYAPLTVFFLSIIFFSVINVWQILSNIQRLVKHTFEKSNELYQTTRPPSDSGSVLTGTLASHNPRSKRRLQISKNNLGYLRPYENKNMANQFEDEKHNLNNHKEFPKETLELQINPAIYLSATKQQTSSNDSGICSSVDLGLGRPIRDAENYQNGQNEMRISGSSNSSTQSEPNGHIGMRVSGNSDTSTTSDVALILHNNVGRLNNSQSSHVVAFQHHQETETAYHIRSHSLDSINVSELCHDLTAGAGISV